MDSRKGELAMRKRGAVIALACGGSLIAASPVANAGFGKKLTSGPGAAKIVQRFDNMNWADNTALREGNARFGRQHIAKGGSTGNKSNHELTATAKALWVKAMNNVQKGSWVEVYKGGTKSTYKYKLKDGTKRTMCVLNESKDFIYGGKNYGPKGIITAYWVKGHVGPIGCSKG
ncbi:hypothetical protein [Streptomyces sp. NPDC052114]|uniref:hypothetical protein n=1 Tax=unclassified Streptomyces TaxID=2593676 RepID=UPI0034137AFA